jgi:hypothetical protein
MPRLSRDKLRAVEEQQRHVVTVRPATLAGGIGWAAALPFIAAAATPVLGSAGKWIGKKIFGKGVKQSGAGVLRSGDRISIQQPRLPKMLTGGGPLAGPLAPLARGSGRSPGGAVYRAGDYPLPSMAPLPHYKSSTTGGLPGAGMLSGVLPTAVKAVSATKKKSTRKGTVKKGSAEAKAKMAALRAMKKKA